MKRTKITESNAKITIPGSRIVVVGGTQGIGEGIALRFARAGAEVWIVGRNEEKAHEILTRLKEASQQLDFKDNSSPEHHFFKVDLTLVAETKRMCDDISTRAGSKGVDYLVMSQGGLPSGRFTTTSEGHEPNFAVQALSRFIITYKLAFGDDSVIRKAVMSIMSPGRTLGTPDYDDLDLVKSRERGKYGMMAAGTRTTVAVDAFTEEFASRSPNLTFLHVFPGSVKTNVMRNSHAPWYLELAFAISCAIGGSTAEAYAEVPFFQLANPEGQKISASSRFWNEYVQPISVHATTGNKENRTKVWNHMVEIFEKE